MERIVRSPVHVGVLIMLVVVTVLAYMGILGHDFINFDDPMQVSANQNVLTGITWENIRYSFSLKSPCSPLTWLAYASIVEVFGPGPRAFHAVSLVLHVLGSLLLFYAIFRMTGEFWKCFLVAALFALHPINVESVAWVAELNNVLSGVFFMLVLITYHVYAKEPGWKRYLLLLVMFELGMLAKPVLMTLPFILLLLDVWPLGRVRLERSDGGGVRVTGVSVKLLVLEKIPLLLLSLVSFASSLMMQPEHTTFITTTQAPMGLRISNAIVSYVKYMGKLVWPFDLGVPYPYPAEVQLWKVLVSVALLVVITVVAVRGVWRRPWILVGWLWFLGAMVPFLGIIQSGLWPEMADRYAYLTFIGLYIVLAWGVPGVIGSGRARLGEYAVYAMIGVAFLAGAATRVQAGYWKDSITLFEHVLRLNPDNIAAQGNLGYELMQQGDPDRAIVHFNEELRLDPKNSRTLFDLGTAYSMKGEYDKAMGFFRGALEITPDEPEIYNAMGSAMDEKGDRDEAIRYYREALKKNPKYLKTVINLGNMMMKGGNADGAVRYYQEALEIDPGLPDVYNNLGRAYFNKREMKKAYDNYQQALRLRPGYALALQNMEKLEAVQVKIRAARDKVKAAVGREPGNPVYYITLAELEGQLGETDGAIGHYLKALELDRGSVKALYGLAVTYVRVEDHARALETLGRLLELQPGNPEVYYNHACVYARQGRVEESVEWLRKALGKGFDDKGLLLGDPDLAGVRDTEAFRALLREIEGR